jgi:hypothetical protein
MPSYYPINMSTGMSAGAPPNVVPSYNPPPHPPQPYQMMPSGGYMQGSQAQRYSGSDSPRNSPRHMQSANAGAMQQHSPSSSPAIQHAVGGVSSQPRNPKSPQIASAKNSPLSLASITSPFHTTDSQSKKYHAQTPKKHLYMAGERLRLAISAREDLVVPFRGAPRLRRQQRRIPRISWLGERLIPICHSRYSLVNQDGTVMCPLWFPCSQPEMRRKKETGCDIISESGDVLLLVIIAVCVMTYYLTFYTASSV